MFHGFWFSKLNNGNILIKTPHGYNLIKGDNKNFHDGLNFIYPTHLIQGFHKGKNFIYPDYLMNNFHEGSNFIFPTELLTEEELEEQNG